MNYYFPMFKGIPMIHYDIIGYLMFAFVTSITPGPNNYLLFSYGKNYGFINSSRLMLGIYLGFSVLLFISGYGIAEIITKNPTIGLLLRAISSIWLLYLAIALSRLNSVVITNSKSSIGFYQGFFLQFVNPKAWIMAISGASAYMPHFENIHISVFLFVFTFGVIGVPCMMLWILFGDVISKLLTSGKVNWAMRIILFSLMMISIVLIWI